MNQVVRIGLLGCGTVGGGVVEALHLNRAALVGRLGAQVVVTRVAVLDSERDRGPLVSREWICDNWESVVTAHDVDIVVEVMGGVEPAREAITTALEHGKDVVTANKELLALHGESLQRLAASLGRTLMCEGSVLGGVPAVHALHTYFVANRIERLRGVVNGTNNYILSRMTDGHQSFLDALSEAQDLGYAEANPGMDVEGKDALFKFQILSRLAFDVEISPSDVDLSGITDVSLEDIEFANRLGGRIRHVVEGRYEEGTLFASIRPQVVSQADALFYVAGADNFLSLEGDLVGKVGLCGPGAGALPTASAVVEDIVKVVQGSAFRLRSLCHASVSPVPFENYLVRRRAPMGDMVGHEAGFAWRADLRAKQVKYLGTVSRDCEAWYVRGCNATPAECLGVVSSSHGGDYAVYPAAQLVSRSLPEQTEVRDTYRIVG